MDEASGWPRRSNVGETVGVDRVLAEQSPAEKVDVVRDARVLGRTVMAGDGVNDAPALASADRLVEDLPASGPDREDVLDLQPALCGLLAVLDLHGTLEDELFSQLPSA